MPPKKYSNITPPPARRIIRTTARKSAVPPRTIISKPTFSPQHSPKQPNPTPDILSDNIPFAQSPPVHKPPIEKLPVSSPCAVIEAEKTEMETPDGEVVSQQVSQIQVESKSDVQTLAPDKGLENDAAIGTEKTGAEPETKKKTAVKKTVRIVKRVVKRKVPKKIKTLSENQMASGNVPDHHHQIQNPSSIENENPISIEAIVENEKPSSDLSVNMEVKNLKHVESVSMEVDTACTTDDTVVMETEHSKSSAVVPDPASGSEHIAPLETGSPSLLGEKQMNLEVSEAEKDRINVEYRKEPEVEKHSDIVMQKESETCAQGKVDGSLTENLDNVQGDFDGANDTDSATKTKSVDKIVDHLGDQKHDCVVENSLNLGSGHGKDKKVEMNEAGGLKTQMSLCDKIMSAEMGALERRRRRKTEIFVGGLDKETKEEDIRKIFEEIGEIKDVTLVKSGNTKKNKGFAFVRYALAADAKKALAKYHKVEICGRQCGTSPVEGNDTLFLGHIDKKWKTDDVMKLLQEIGIEKIDHVTVIADPCNTDLNRGFAFLELESIKDAQNAYKKLQKKGVFRKHLHVKVSWAEPLIEPDETELTKIKSVFAEYLPSSWDEEKVKGYFKRFGEIENVALAKDMPSSRRKDFAFVNYTTREAALACVEEFSQDQIIDEGTKVKVKVSLAKPIAKGQQTKLRTPPSKELSKEKQKATPSVSNLHERRITGKVTSSNNDDRRVDRGSSMTSELVQLLREQASLRQTQPGSGLGFVNPQYSYAPAARKRPFSVLGDNSHIQDPRGHPRSRVEGSYPITNPSVSIHHVDMASLPRHHQQGTNFISGSHYGIEGHPQYIQTRERALYQSAPYHGISGINHRY